MDPKAERHAAAAYGKRASPRAVVAATLVLFASLALAGSAASGPARDAGSAATVTVSIGAMPFGIAELTEASGTKTECSWNEGTDCRVSVATGQEVRLTARLDPDAGDPLAAQQRFHGWSTPECGAAATCTLTDLSAPVQAFALFTPAVFDVRIGGAGVVESSDAGGLRCESGEFGNDCRYTLDAGQSITLLATPENAGESAEWVFGCDPGDDAKSSTCTTRSENRVVGVRFGNAEAPSRPFDVSVHFTVTKGGSGSGTVSGPSLSCGSSCTTTVGFGARLKLTTTAAAGSRFDRWVGAPCGTQDTCTLNAGPVTSVRAVFEALPAPAPPPPSPPPPPPPPAQPAPPSAPKLAASLLQVRSVRYRGRTRIVFFVRTNRVAMARLRLTRGTRILANRLVLVPARGTTTWVQVPRGTRRGQAWLVVRLRDSNGTIVTLKRRLVVAG